MLYSVTSFSLDISEIHEKNLLYYSLYFYNYILDSPIKVINIFLSIGLLILSFFLWRFFFSPKCPNCNLRNTRRLISKDLVSKTEGYQTVNRRDTIHIHGSHGQQGQWGSISRKEQVHVISSTFNNTYTCISCRCRWSIQSVEHVEG